MAIVTKAQVKSFLQIPTSATSYDSLIESLIPVVEADYERIRGKAFDTNDDDETTYPDTASFTAAQMVGWLMRRNPAVKRESIGGYSYENEITMQGYPISIFRMIDRHVRF